MKAFVNTVIAAGLITTAAVTFSVKGVRAEDSAIVIGKSTFGARCALCHGIDGKGGGEIAELFQVPPSDLTTLAKNEGGRFPFPRVYETIVEGMEKKGHGNAEMPIWGDYFMADAIEDRGISAGDALHIAQGRILSLAYYLELIQE